MWNKQKKKDFLSTVKTELPFSKGTYSAIYKAAGQAFSWRGRPPGTIPAAGPIHGLWEFQELYQELRPVAL